MTTNQRIAEALERIAGALESDGDVGGPLADIASALEAIQEERIRQIAQRVIKEEMALRRDAIVAATA